MRTVSAALGMVVLVATASAGASLTATAGVGGAARPGRWTPVTVSVANPDPRLSGHLVVTWGDAVVRRRLIFDSPGTRQIEFYLRTSDAADRLQVRLEGSGTPIEIAVPIRIVRDDERFDLCVIDDASAGSSASCTASVPAPALPASVRGYEAVDQVLWPLGRSRLRPDQSSALRQFETLKRLNQRGDLSLTPQPARPTVGRGLPTSTGRAVLGAAALYLSLLCFLAWTCTRRARPAAWAAIGIAAAVAAGSAASLAVGRVGPARAVTVHHQSVLQQIPGSDAALLSMRAIAEFPVRGTTALRLPAVDGVIEQSLSRGRAVEELDADGFPTLDGEFSLGARRAFGAEAVISGAVLTVDDRGTSVRITNRSPYALDGCQLANGLRGAAPEVLPPGGVIEAARIADDDTTSEVLGPAVLCTTTQPAIALTETHRPVIMQGTTIVAAYMTPPTSEALP
jgi:hypothetical protein